MSVVAEEVTKNLKYLCLLAQQYPTIQSACTEIINLRAILNLPKGTEHFVSDIHGEHEAFTHLMNNCSGVIKEKVDDLFSGKMSELARKQLCSLIYYPEEKLGQIKADVPELDKWYEYTLFALIDICRIIASKYTRSKVRKALPKEFAYIIDELMHADYTEENQTLYYDKIMESILSLNIADSFITALSSMIKRLAVDRLHVVGDIFDRGARPDLVMDMLCNYHCVDIQWGNHDILWMGAAAGNEACIANVINNSATFCNLEVLENGYGINLRPLALFAQKVYRESSGFAPRLVEGSAVSSPREMELSGKIHKAIAIMMFKIEGQLIKRHPEYKMQNRLLLDKLDLKTGTVLIEGSEYPLIDSDLPTIFPDDPYRLTDEEAEVIASLKNSFINSERLQTHVRFLYSNGSMYKCYNHNLMYHGCVPMNDDGSFQSAEIDGKLVSGKALMDAADNLARRAYFGVSGEREAASDAMWYMWCGSRSPLFGRARMTTFERLFVLDKSTHAEPSNAYYNHIQNAEGCTRILEEFGLYSEVSHIINGHVPVKAGSGENPVKGGGRLIVIDGGFCKAYQPRTGIAGYTLIYNSYGLRLSSHMPFESIKTAVEKNADIHSTTQVFETMRQRMKVMDTDEGQEISEQIFDLSLLVNAYRSGIIKQNTHKAD